MNNITFPCAFVIKLLAAGCSIALAASTPLHAATYDAVADFSLNGNPNGVWSYGSLSGLTGGTFTLFSDAGANYDYAGEQFWINDFNASIPNRAAVVKNTTGSDLQYSTVIGIPDQLNLDGENFIADVRWIAPTDGTYSVEGLFQRNDTRALPVSVDIIEDSTTMLFSLDNFTTNGSQQPFNLTNLALPAGTILDFAEGAGQFSNDSTGLAATITSAPEPSSILLLGAALLGLAFRRLRPAIRIQPLCVSAPSFVDSTKTNTAS